MPAIRSQLTTRRSATAHSPVLNVWSRNDRNPSKYISSFAKPGPVQFPSDYDSKLRSFIQFYLDSLPSEKIAQASSLATDIRRKKKINNAFIIYRSFVNKYKIMVKGLHQDKVSCHAAVLWNALDAESKQPFYRLSSEEKLRNALYGPVYIIVQRCRKSEVGPLIKKQTAKIEALIASPSKSHSPDDTHASVTASTSRSITPQSLSSSPDTEPFHATLYTPDAVASPEAIVTHCNDTAMSSKFNHHLASPPFSTNQETDLLPLNDIHFASGPDWIAYDDYLPTYSSLSAVQDSAATPNDRFGGSEYSLFDPFGLSVGSSHIAVENESAIDGTENWALLMDLAFAARRPA